MSVVLHDQKSMIESVRWGMQSIMDGEQPMFCAEQSPRAIRLLNITPPRFISSFFHITLPDNAGLEPQPLDKTYWAEVHDVLASMPNGFKIQSGAFDEMCKKLIPSLENEETKIFLEKREVHFFILSFIRPPIHELRVPELVAPWVFELVVSMGSYFEDHLDTAQHAMNTVLFSLAQWEIGDRLGLARDKLKIPVFLIPQGVPDGLLLVGAQAQRSWRQTFYENWVPKQIRALSFAEYEVRCNAVRVDPLLVVSLLNRMPMTFPTCQFELDFASIIYAGIEPVPSDVGRQALAFCCQNIKTIWVMMGWPRLRIVHKRLWLLADAGWRIKLSEFAKVVYHKLL